MREFDSMISSLTAEKLACARGDSALFDGSELSRHGGPGAGGGRRQWRGQDLAAAPDRGLSGARGRHASSLKTDSGESDDAEERGKSSRLAGPSGRPQAATDRASSNWTSSRACMAQRRRCRACWNRSGWRARPICPAAISPPDRGGGWRWRGCWSAARPLWLLDEPFAALDTAGQALVAQSDGARIAARAASSSPPPMSRWALAMKA